MPLPPLPMTMPGPRREDDDLRLVGGALDLDAAMFAFCRYSLTARLMRMSSWSHLA